MSNQREELCFQRRMQTLISVMVKATRHSVRASGGGHHEIVRILMEALADVNKRGREKEEVSGEQIRTFFNFGAFAEGRLTALLRRAHDTLCLMICAYRRELY